MKRIPYVIDAIYGMFPLLKNADMLMSTIVKQRRIRVDMSRCSHLVSSTPEKVNGIPALSKKACTKNMNITRILKSFLNSNQLKN